MDYPFGAREIPKSEALDLIQQQGILDRIYTGWTQIELTPVEIYQLADGRVIKAFSSDNASPGSPDISHATLYDSRKRFIELQEQEIGLLDEDDHYPDVSEEESKLFDLSPPFEPVLPDWVPESEFRELIEPDADSIWPLASDERELFDDLPPYQQLDIDSSQDAVAATETEGSIDVTVGPVTDIPEFLNAKQEILQIVADKQVILESAINQGSLQAYESLLAPNFIIKLISKEERTRQQHLAEFNEAIRDLKNLVPIGFQYLDVGLRNWHETAVELVPRNLEKIAIERDQVVFVFATALILRHRKSKVHPEREFNSKVISQFIWRTAGQNWLLQSIRSEGEEFFKDFEDEY